jgi:transcriptional regulator with XRE-family HTH domain
VKSTYSDDYQRLIALLVDSRKAASITQQGLAKALGRPQSFVSKFERGNPRIAVIEFRDICRAIKADPLKIMRRIDLK